MREVSREDVTIIPLKMSRFPLCLVGMNPLPLLQRAERDAPAAWTEKLGFSGNKLGVL